MEQPKNEEPKKGMLANIKDKVVNKFNEVKDNASEAIRQAEEDVLADMMEGMLPKAMKFLPKITPQIEEKISEFLDGGNGRIITIQKDANGKVVFIVLNKDAVELNTKEGKTGEDAVDSMFQFNDLVELLLKEIAKKK